MKLTRLGAAVVLWTVSFCVFSLRPAIVWATSPPTLAVPVGLSLAEIKVTGDEFVMLQNNTGAAISDLSIYWLYNFNNSNPLASGVSSSTQQLPLAPLDIGQTILLSANGGATCGAAVTDKLSISLTDSMGFLEVVQQSLVGGALVQTAGDAVNWGSTTSQATGAIGTVPSSTSAPLAAYYRYQNSVASPPFLWQRADVTATNVCQLTVTVSGVATPGPSSPGNQLLPGLPPPVQIITLATSIGASPSLPASDIGLRTPQINELLPNPASPQTDAQDEFIEIYNSNVENFDLSGFILQTGTTNLHKYTFPSGVKLAPKSFTAFSLRGTGLSLSNSDGQVVLFDPLGNAISKTDVYSSAKDGQAWALAEGKWYWTTSPTPSAENVINEPGAGGGKNSSGGQPQILSASTTSQGSGVGTASTGAGGTAVTPLHPFALAGVGGLAVLYAGYEYRTDLANNLHRLRRYREARVAAGPKAKGR